LPAGVPQPLVRVSRSGSAVGHRSTNDSNRRSVAVDCGHCSSSINQCAPLVSNANSIGFASGVLPSPRISALLTSASAVPMTTAGRCMSIRQSSDGFRGAASGKPA
jgi:hypothetical protein